MNAASTDTRPPAMLRIAGDGYGDGLELSQIAPLVQSGQVSVVGLEAIAERLGDRWAVRRGLIQEHARKVLTRHLGPQAIIHRIGDTDFLVATPCETPVGGQALCLNSLRDILQHFLGEALASDLRVHQVTRLAPDGVYGQRIDAAAVAAADARAPGARPAADPPSPNHWTPFVAANGRQVRVSCVLEPVLHLKTSARIGFRMARRVLWMPTDTPLTQRELSQLSRGDIERVDFATISRGLDRLRNESAHQPTLIVPVSYVTLSNARGRAILADYLRVAKEEVRHGLVCEVCDIDGVPPGALLAAISLLRPFCLHVIGHVRETGGGALRTLRESGLEGIAVERQTIEDDAGFIGWARALVAAARPLTKTVFAYRLQSLRQAAIAATLGITHASIAAGPAAPRPHYLDDVAPAFA